MNPEYVYKFSPLTDQYTQVKLILPRTNKEFVFQAGIFDSQLLLQGQKRIPAEIADIIDLAMAVYTGDRLSITQQRSIPRHIRVILPVRRPEIIGQPKVVEKLSEILHWFTNDFWSFQFEQRLGEGRNPELQDCFPTDDIVQKEEIALWSGGLDSLAGFYNRIRTNTAERYILMGTGGNNYIQKLQETIAKAVEQKFPGRVRYIPVPIHLAETYPIGKNSRPRSRGFVFMLIGAATALLKEQSALYIYENGIGAINLPFREAEIGLDHSRAVHPLSLIKLSEFISNLFGNHFEYINPFLFWTKAQMCKALVDDGLSDLIFKTVSCDRRRRLKDVVQCGLCSSCLLRQQAIIASGIEDHTKYVRDLRPTEFKSLDKRYFQAMIYQVEHLDKLINSSNRWQNLAKEYTSLLEIAVSYSKYEGIDLPIIKDNLSQLYRTYIEEWRSVEGTIRQKIAASEQIRLVA